jgi:hypothetical protein
MLNSGEVFLESESQRKLDQAGRIDSGADNPEGAAPL